jgi:hypothetical protein
LEQVACAQQLGRDPVADPSLERDQPVEDEQARPVSDCGKPGREVVVAGLGVESACGGDLAGWDAGADIELRGEVIVGVEQEDVQRVRLWLSLREVATARPPQGLGLYEPSVFD